MAVKDLGPLLWDTPIVDAQGRPSPEFQRRWNTQRNNNAQIGTITFGAGAPTGSPDDGAEYVDTSHIPYTLYVGQGGSWHKAGVTKFTELSDAPSAYTGAGNKIVQVNSGATGLIFSTISSLLDLISSTRGTVLYRGASGWSPLAPGTAGYVLSTNGAGADPAWVAQSGGGGGVSYDPVILAETSLTHFWKMNEPAGSTSFVDSKGGPSLTVTDTISNIAAGAPGVINDTETSVYFGGKATKSNGLVSIPLGVVPSTGDYTLEFLMQWHGNHTSGLISSNILTLDVNGTTSDMNLYIDANRTVVINDLRGGLVGVDNYDAQFAIPAFKTVHLVFVMNATANTCTTYVNGLVIPGVFSGTLPRQSGGSAGAWGSYLPSRDSNSYPFMGRIAKFAIYNAQLTASKVAAHFAATGLA